MQTRDARARPGSVGCRSRTISIDVSGVAADYAGVWHCAVRASGSRVGSGEDNSGGTCADRPGFHAGPWNGPLRSTADVRQGQRTYR